VDWIDDPDSRVRILELAVLVAAGSAATVTRYLGLRAWVFGSRQRAAPPLSPATSARVLAASDAAYVAPDDPGGPRESVHSGRPTLAPVSAAIARSTRGSTPLSANTARTWSRRIAPTRRATSAAEGDPAVEREGITAPTTRSP
jgi:type IV secretory pathway TrbL component